MLQLSEASTLHSPWTPLEASFRTALSVERLRRYRKERDKQSWAPAIGRYLFNVELASALHPALNWAEVALRNHLHAIITDEYPLGNGRGYNRVGSWLDAVPPILLPPEQEKVLRAIGDFDRRNVAYRRQPGHGGPAKVLNEGRLVAELGLGFWTRLLDGVYADWRNPGNPRFWPRLLNRAFPHCPALRRTRKDIHGRFTQIKELRNRTFHHERISHQLTLERYDEVLEAVHWIDPALADALRERERPRFKAVQEGGHQPFVEWVTARTAPG
ncbi:MAG TPA: hypothetical protein VFJ16_25725 [Longimicrobium sp.]|nr:hypothetical protein [Longimicrobium sp.]